MFSSAITGLNIIEPFADAVVKNVACKNDGPNGDRSFLATLRALFARRLPKDASMTLHNYVPNKNYFSADKSFSEILKQEFEIPAEPYQVALFLTDDAATRASFIEKAAAEGLTRLAPVERFVNQFGFDIGAFTNKDGNSCYVVLNNNIRTYHVIQATVTNLLPSFFPNKIKDITTDEHALLESAMQRSSTAYHNCISKLSAQFDFKTAKTIRLLSDFRRNNAQRDFDNAKRDYDNQMQHIHELEERYRSGMETLRSIDLRLRGAQLLLRGESDEENTLAQFFMANKAIELDKVEKSMIRFHVGTYLSFWDPDVYDHMSKRKASHLYPDLKDAASPFNDKDNVKKLFDQIFGEEPTIRVKLYSYFKVNVSDSWVEVCSRQSVPNDYMPAVYNPHFYFHACLGGHRPLIEKKLREGDVEGAIAQCIASGQSIDVGESTTMGEFAEQLFTSLPVCLELPDGKVVNAVEALKWINEKEKKDAAD